MRLVFSPAAVRDLQSISDYTLQTWGSGQESLYLKGLWRKLDLVRSLPEIHTLREDLVIGCRSVRHEKHVIFFSVDGEFLQVIRILHGAMDFDQHLRDDLI